MRWRFRDRDLTYICAQPNWRLSATITEPSHDAIHAQECCKSLGHLRNRKPWLIDWSPLPNISLGVPKLQIYRTPNPKGPKIEQKKQISLEMFNLAWKLQSWPSVRVLQKEVGKRSSITFFFLFRFRDSFGHSLVTFSDVSVTFFVAFLPKLLLPDAFCGTVTFRIPHKKSGFGGRLAWYFQSRRAILKMFNLWARRGSSGNYPVFANTSLANSKS